MPELPISTGEGIEATFRGNPARIAKEASVYGKDQKGAIGDKGTRDSKAQGAGAKQSTDSLKLSHIIINCMGVTLLLLWTEYRKEHPEDGYRYSRFCELYEAWCEQQEIRMPQQHKDGERLFVDYTGDTIPIIDRSTGLVLFDAILQRNSLSLSA